MRAQIYALIAAVRSGQGRSTDVHAATAQARQLLTALPSSPAIDLLRHRLTLTDGANAETRQDIEAAIPPIEAIVRQAPPNSLLKACSLAARADLRAESLELDLAAADGLAAYAIAEQGGFAEARIQAAESLAELYRRSGLRDEAERMINEILAYERTHDHPAQVATMLYMRGQILTEARNFGEARAVLNESRRIAEESGDHFGALYTDIALCPALIDSGDLDEAERVCGEGSTNLVLAERADLTTLMHAYLARIDLERGRPLDAVRKLDDVLGPHARDVVAHLEPQIYLDRARARAALGRSAEAYTDLKHSLELQKSIDREQRARTAAVLKGTADAENLKTSNRLLEERIARQHAELAQRTLSQNFAVVAASAAALVGLLLGVLLWVTRRHARLSRRQETLLSTLSTHAPDALMLLDSQRRVLFGNRNLFDESTAPERGRVLESIVPMSVHTPLRKALNEIFEQRKSTTFTASVTDADGSIRHFELRGVPVIEGSELIGATIRSLDVTAIRRLEREIVDVTTRERQRLSHDLHEGLGQDLAGLSFLLQSTGVDIERGRPVVQETINELSTHVQRMIGITRDIAHWLSPLQVARGSLSSALERLAAEVRSSLDIGVELSSTPADIIVPETMSEHLYRIAAEAVMGAARFRQCNHILLELAITNGVLQLSITDDGFDAQPKDSTSDTHAAEMIAYRARLIGGSIQRDSLAQNGTRLIVTVPVTKAA
jgi:two-component system, NarL family, sensor histidine kinase UhpB